MSAIIADKYDLLALFRKLLGDKAIIFPFDLGIEDAVTNAAVQPRNGYTVQFTLPLPKELQERHGEVKLYTIVDDALSELKLDFADANGVWCADFETGHFSPYAFVILNEGVPEPGEIAGDANAEDEPETVYIEDDANNNNESNPGTGVGSMGMAAALSGVAALGFGVMRRKRK